MKTKIKQILLLTQRWTKTDMVYLARGGFWLTVGQIAMAVSGIILAIILANWLSPESYGIYKYVLSVTGLLILTSLTGMNTAIIRTVSNGFEGAFSATLKKRIQWGMIGGLIGICVAGYYWYQADHTLAIAFLSASIFIPFIDSFNLYSSFLNGRKYFKQFGLYNLIFFIGLVVALGLSVFFSRNILLIIIAYFFYNTFMRLFFLLYIGKKFKLNSETEKDTIQYGKHLSLQNIIMNISDYFDKILIFYLLGPIQVAIYSIATIPIQQIRGPQLRGFGRLVLPKVSNRSLGELKASLPRKIFILSLIIVPLVALYIFIAPYIYRLIFPQYIESIIYSQVFALTLLSFPMMLVTNILLAHSLKKQLYILRIISPVLKIVLLAVLLPVYGIWGAISSFLAIEVVNSGLLFYFWKNLDKYKVKDI